MLETVNHLTYAVRNLEKSLKFYGDFLGMKVKMKSQTSAYLASGEIWIALVVNEKTKSNSQLDYTHQAFTVSREYLGEIRHKMRVKKMSVWQENSTEGDSIYLLDPDGHKLELHTTGLAERMEFLKQEANPQVEIFE